MSTGTKRGQFFRSSSGSFPCLSPPIVFVAIATIFCFVGYNYWSQSHRVNSCKGEISRLREKVRMETNTRIQMQGRLSELHVMVDRQTKLFAVLNKKDAKSDERGDDKDNRILSLENELIQVKEKAERCSMSNIRNQIRPDESDNSVRSSTAIRNKTLCDLEIARQFEEIDKWIKSMVDDRTYSQFQLKFSKDGEKSEADKLQKLEKVVMQRDEIKAVKDERIKEEIRARETKSNEGAALKPSSSRSTPVDSSSQSTKKFGKSLLPKVTEDKDPSS